MRLTVDRCARRYLTASNYDFSYDRSKNLRPKRNIKSAMNHGAPTLQLVTPGLGEPRTPGLSLAATTATMGYKRYKPVNPTGFNCVNVVVQRAITKVKEKAKQRERSTAHYNANKKDAKHKRKVRYENTKESTKMQMASNHQKNRKDRLVVMKTYREEHRKERNTNDKKRRRSDPVFQLTEKCRSALTRFAKRNGVSKSGGTARLLGCSYAELTARMNAQLDNRDKDTYESDHVFPFLAFKNEITSAQPKVMHYSNLQPLTVEENAHKRGKLPTKAMAAKVDPACWPDGITMDMLPDIYPGWATPLRM